VQPFNNNQRDPQTGADFVKDKILGIQNLSNKKVLAKEVGWPTAGDDAATEENQELFFNYLKTYRDQINYAYFEGFNQLFKVNFPFGWEPHYGLWDENRNEKSFIENNTP